MSLFHTHEKCSRCNMSLTMWNTSTCTRCGCKLCGHHTHLLRAPHSSVLVSVCDACMDGAVTMIATARLSSEQATLTARR
jgi:hypothetical protein